MQQITDDLVIRNQLPHRAKVFISSRLNMNGRAYPESKEKAFFLTLGELKYAKSPEEMAQVLAHELSHIQNHDHKFFKARLCFPGIAALTAAVLTTFASYRYNQKQKQKHQLATFTPFESITVLISSLIAFISAIKLNNVLRKRQELRADRDAIKYLQKAGYISDGYKTFPKEINLFLKGREDVLSLKEKWRQLLLGGIAHPTMEKRRALLDSYRKLHPDPQITRPIMTKSEWKALQSRIEPIYDQLELERSIRVLDMFYLNPKALSKILK